MPRCGFRKFRQITYAHITWSINTCCFSTTDKQSSNSKQPGSLY
uniref:Uncharacterized protein n=1 Tax=Arundo donax TaxID=35708 RepID=A0A0A9BBY7_ARUDO